MSSLETRKIEPQSGTTVTLGAGGDTVLVSASQLKTNTVKDAGGNTLFISDGAGTLSSVNSALSGSMTFISSQTASNSASIFFTSGIDSTYDEYVFFFININPTADGSKFTFQCDAAGNDSYNEEMITTFFEAENDEAAGGGSLGYKTGNDQAAGYSFQDLTREIGSDADQSGSGELHLFAPSSSIYVKQFYSRASSSSHSDYERDSYVAGYMDRTSAISRIQFKMDTGLFDGTIYLYGIS